LTVFFIFGLFGLLPIFPGRRSINGNQNLIKLAEALLLICVSISIIFGIIFAIYNNETAKNLALFPFVGLGILALVSEVYKERRRGVATIIDFLGSFFLLAAGASFISDFFFQIKFLISGQSYNLVIIIGGILVIIGLLLDEIWEVEFLISKM